MIQTATAESLRRILLPIVLLSMLGTGAELLFLGHTEGPMQWIPVALLGLGILTLCWTVSSDRAVCVRTFRLTMAVFVASGLAGIVLHYRNNLEFELGMYPSSEGWNLFSSAMTGALPALAPGAMIQIGLVGLAYTFRHPALLAPTALKTAKRENENETHETAGM
jgi:hypothetical protein